MLEIIDINFNPPGNDKNKEWIVLKNFSDKFYFLKGSKKGWKIFDGKYHYFKSSVIIGPKEEVYIVQNKDEFLKNFPQFKDKKLVESSFYLKNSGGIVKIFDENNNLITQKEWPILEKLISVNEIGHNWLEFKFLGDFSSEVKIYIKSDKKEINLDKKINPKEIFTVDLEGEKFDVFVNNYFLGTYYAGYSNFEGKFLKNEFLTPGKENIYFKNYPSFLEAKSFSFWPLLLILSIFVFIYFLKQNNHHH